jgi:TRAP-type C4-dicarboxylate transport system permease large subunit
MIVIVGLIVLLVAVIVGFTGVLTNAGPAHPLSENFSVFGYHVTGSTGTLFLFGIVVGAVGMLGLCVLLAGARRTAGRGRDARHELKRSQRETAFLNQERDQRLEHQQAGAASGSAVPQLAPTRRNRVPLLGRFSRGRQPTGTGHVAGPR